MTPSAFSLLATGVLLAATAAGAPPSAPKLLLSEDFESTAAGQIPAGFTKTGAIAVVDDVAHSGKKSLRIDPAPKGGRKITKEGPEIAALGGQFWGRLYYKVKLPVPVPVVPEGKPSGIIHSTLVAGQAVSPLAKDSIEFRMMGTILKGDGSFRYLFNVQPKGGRAEFGVTARTPSHHTDEWTLVEWSVDHATQSYHFYVNGEEQKELALAKGEGQFAGVEVPEVFQNLSFGWTNYQPAAGEGFTAWLDDIALAKERIGPVAAAKK